MRNFLGLEEVKLKKLGRLFTFVKICFFFVSLTNASVAVAAGVYVPGQVIVKLKGDANSNDSHAFIGKAVSSQKMSLVNSWREINLHRFSFKVGQKMEDVLGQLSKDPNVEFAEPNWILNKMEMVEENSVQTMGTRTTYDIGTIEARRKFAGYAQTGAPVQVNEAWAELAAGGIAEASEANGLTALGASVPVVAVIDTGVDIEHFVFVQSEAIWTNTKEIPRNGIDDDNNGFVDDVNGWNFVEDGAHIYDDDGHGTHVAGIVLGASQDILVRSPALARIKIMPLKFMSGDGSGTTSDAIQAIYYAVNNGANILNNSWGGEEYGRSLHEALTYAYSKKVLIVTASGNFGTDNDVRPIYPANLDVPGLVSVGATTDWDTLAGFSDYGANTVHIGSPGSSILSTFPNSRFGYSSGTSMAAPFVAGVAAMLLLETPQLTGYQLKEVLLNSSEAVEKLSGKIMGSHRIDVLSAVKVAKMKSGEGSYQPPYSPVYGESSGVSESNSRGIRGGCGLIKSIGQTTGSPPFGVLFGMLLLPVILVIVLSRGLAKPGNRRQHERFKMSSEIKVFAGGRELIGRMSTISAGGISFNADTMLEKGGVITMQIRSPDGNEQIQVEGRVVWSEENKAYGVQFAQVQSGIANWTQSLVKAKL